MPMGSRAGLPWTEPILICRADLNRTEAVLEEVWNLAQSPMAAHWSHDAFFSYLSTESASGVFQAKAIFVAYANGAVPGTTQAEGAQSVPPVELIVGFAAFSAILTVGAGEATLENMAVAPAWQRQGVGCRLLRAGLLWCRAHGAGSVFLEVRETNQRAVALYKRAGFSVVGHRPGYYREPVEDGLQMEKSLVLRSRPVEISSC